MNDELLTVDTQDLCAHRWESLPCMDLGEPMRYWSIARCRKCDMQVGDPQGGRSVDWESLPKFGKGRAA